MTLTRQKQDSKKIAPALIRWFEQNARVLPWRKTRDPYKIWISEMMLQQTTVNTVIDYYERWIRQYPTVEDVAKAPLQQILKSWQGLGYYQRARNLHRSSQIIVAEHEGKIPEKLESLRRLPGFGPYTAGAVLSIAYDQRQPIIDANIRRVVMRVLALSGKADNSQDQRIGVFLEEILPQKNIRIVNQALMEIGALVCRSREPLCAQCPVAKFCVARSRGIQETIPETVKRQFTNVEVAVGILQDKGKFFIQQRPASGLWADMWEFPGGKLEKGEAPAAALHREIHEELSISLSEVKPLLIVRHFYTQYKVKLHAFLCRSTARPRVSSKRKWVSLTQLHQYPMPSANAKIIAALAKIPLDK